jgi:hypothetical protein
LTSRSKSPAPARRRDSARPKDASPRGGSLLRSNGTWGATTNHARVRVTVFNYHEIDVPNHRFTVEFFAEFSWTDGRAQEFVGREDISNELWEQGPNFASGDEKLWTPRLRFSNLLDTEDCAREEWFNIFSGVDGPPIVCQCIRMTATFSEFFELADFPWDAQDLAIAMTSDIAVTEAEHRCSCSRVRLNTGDLYRSLPPRPEEFQLRAEYGLGQLVWGFDFMTAASKSASNRRCA